MAYHVISLCRVAGDNRCDVMVIEGGVAVSGEHLSLTISLSLSLSVYVCVCVCVCVSS